MRAELVDLGRQGFKPAEAFRTENRRSLIS